jgi:hypothetical protein
MSAARFPSLGMFHRAALYEIRRSTVIDCEAQLDDPSEAI